MKLDEVLENLRKNIKFKDDTNIGDTILIGMKSGLFFGVVQDIENNVKITIKDFVRLYNTRYVFLQSLLKQRQELQGATTIRKIYSSQDREQVAFIGMVLERMIL